MSNLKDPLVLRRVLGPFVAAAILVACASAPSEPAKPAPPIMVGSDRDVHGCKASAGYTWCEREGACVRPWELAREKGLEKGDDAFARYCRPAAQCDETGPGCRREGESDGRRP